MGFQFLEICGCFSPCMPRTQNTMQAADQRLGIILENAGKIEKLSARIENGT